MLDQGGRAEAGVEERQGHGFRHALLPRDGCVHLARVCAVVACVGSGVGFFVL